MVIENIMYFALGLLAAGLVSLIILPAVWKRAVRLTKRRIEAATPITMAEFRADKDQLRAEFALTTRKLEITVDTLRARLAEQLSEVNQARSDMGMLKVERDQHQLIASELQAREAQLRERVAELEREGTDLAQRLRMRDRDFETRGEELERLRDTMRGGPATGSDTLSGDYDEDVDRLTAALATERKRVLFLEDQAKSLISRLETSDRRSAEATAAIAQMRDALAARQGEDTADAENLVAAEARIASAENQLSALLAQSAGQSPALLADELGREDALDELRRQVLDIESTIRSDWDTDRFDENELREKLNEIAANVSRLVYAADTETLVESVVEESLFDRVQRFADEMEADPLPLDPPPATRRGSVSDRMIALQEIQGR